MMALRCLLGRTLKPRVGFCGGGGVTARNCSLKAGDRLREWDFRSIFHPGSPVFEDFPSLKDFADRKPIAAPQGMDPEYFRRSFTGGIACAGPVTDPTVVEPACSAVQQYNVQQNAKLEFVRVLRGYVEVGLPTKFILILEAIDAGMKKKCRAEILQDASSNYDMVLQSFEVVSGSPET